MPNPRLLALVTALSLVASGAQPAATEEDLVAIAEYLRTENYQGLWQYLIENPDLMDESTDLGLGLISFFDTFSAGLAFTLTAVPTPEVAEPLLEIY